MQDTIEKIRAMPLWRGEIHCEPLGGGLTNLNYLITDTTGQYVVRIGEDIVEHHILRFNELAASRAAHLAGLSPKVIFSEPGVMVLQYLKAKTFAPRDVCLPANLTRIVAIIRQCHFEIPKHLRGPILTFNVFHLLRDYAHTLRDGKSQHLPRLASLMAQAQALENIQTPITPVFAHNDLLAANFLDDGDRLWLIDWDYAGFNTPLFDLANLASNNEFDQHQERQLLEAYWGCPANDTTWRQYQTVKCASLLREAMWSMVSELHSKIDHDFNDYTRVNLERYENAYAMLEK